MQDLQVSSSYTSELPGDAQTENKLRQARNSLLIVYLHVEFAS